MKYIIFLVLLFTSTCFSTNVEDYFGKYLVKSDSVKISFLFDENGIDSVVVNNALQIDSLTYDILGIYGSAMLLEIRISNNKEKYEIILNMLILVENNCFIVGAGYYLKVKNSDDDITKIIDKSALIIERQQS